MAKGNDGNYLQHCIEVEAALHLVRTGSRGRLHVALTHGMQPFEQISDPGGNAYRVLYDALSEAAGKPLPDERKLVEAYRKSWALQAYLPNVADLFVELKEEEHYPNTAELLRAVFGTKRLSGGICELDETKHRELSEAWAGSEIVVARSSWREQLGPNGALGCPDRLDAPWLFSMDPMTYAEEGDEDDDKLHRSDFGRLARTLERYVGSGQPGVAALFVYSVGNQGKNRQRQFWKFMDDLAERLEVYTCSYWVAHRGGSLNLAGLLFSGNELALGFVPPRIGPGRGRPDRRTGRPVAQVTLPPKASPESWLGSIRGHGAITGNLIEPVVGPDEWDVLQSGYGVPDK